MTTTLEDRHRQISDHISKSIIPLMNTMDMSLVAALTTTDRATRTTTALAWRGRTRADAVRFTHAADIAERMSDLFTTASERRRSPRPHLVAYPPAPGDRARLSRGRRADEPRHRRRTRRLRLA